MLDLKDIATLIDVDKELAEKKRTPKMSLLARSICSGEKLDQYSTASEAEAALMLSLHNSGYDENGIKYVFDNNPCQGHYREKHKAKSLSEGNCWFHMTYMNAVAFSKNESPTRRKLRELRSLANAVPWSNVSENDLFDTYLEIAYKAGRFDISLSARDAALGAGIGISSASRGMTKIIEAGFVSLFKKGQGYCC